MRELYIATLGFNRDNAAELLRLIDAGQVGQVRFLCSTYYANTDGEVVTWLQGELRARKAGRLLAIRNHAKILLMGLSDGTYLVNESSANLRSCRNIEQFSLSNDADLYAFHKRWMDHVFSGESDKADGRPKTDHHARRTSQNH